MPTTRLPRIAANALSIFSSDAVNRATTFLLYLLVARHLGAYEFGQMSLALTFFYVFQVIAVSGLRTLITREVAKDPAKTDLYLVNAIALVLLSSLLSILILSLCVRLLEYSSETASVILLVSLGIFPYSVSAVYEAVFQGRQQMRYIAYANIPVHMAKVSLAFLLLAQGYGLAHLVGLLLASYAAIAVIESCLMWRHVSKPRFGVDLAFALDLCRRTGVFLGIDGIIALMSALPIFLLSKLATETEVGLYTAATQLMIPVTLVYQSMVTSVFPIMCQTFDGQAQALKHMTERLLELLFAIGLPTVIALFLLADEVLVILYGRQEFLSASPALRILAWNLMLLPLTQALGQIFLAGRRETITLRIGAIDTLVIVASGFILIERFGVIGAALATLLTGIVNAIQHSVMAARLLPKIAMGRLLWKPAIAAAAMGLYLTAFGNRPLILTLLTAPIVYAVLLLCLFVWSSGGVHQARVRYQFLWSQVRS
jgi:O-antigen/teichoic acid export membrane protein